MNTLIEALNAWADHALRFAWPMLWQSSLLIALLFALDVLTRRRLRPAVRYALWLVVLVKLLLPPSLAFPTGPGWWLRPAQAGPPRPRPTTPVVVTYDAHDMPAPSFTAAPVFIAPPPPRLTPASWTLVGMAGVSLGLLAWMLLRWLQVAREARRSPAAPPSLSELFPELPRSLRLKLTDHPLSPAVCGLFRPVILLPRLLAEQLPPAQLRAVLLHELLHLRRGDVWVNCAQALLQIAYWWHPLLWLANARIRRVREEAVDDAVMLALKEDAETYAPTLLEVAKLALHRPMTSLGLVGILESRSSLRQRIERLMDFCPPREAGLTLGSVLAVFGFAALAVPMGQAPASTSGSGTSLEQEASVGSLMQDGKLLYVLGKFEEAKAKFTQAVQADPQDKVANNYLQFVDGAIERHNAIRQKVSHIRLDRISFDGLPLNQVARLLADEIKNKDPEKRGVAFVVYSINNKSASPQATSKPGTGLPSPTPVSSAEVIWTLPITIRPALVDVQLVDVLDAIVKAAGQPIEYSIKDDCIAFSASTSSEPPTLYVRTFKIASDSFVEGLHRAMGLSTTSGPEGVVPLFRDYLAKAGVDLGPPKTVFYNDRQGLFRIRATLQDLDIIEREIAILGVEMVETPDIRAVPLSAASDAATNTSPGPVTTSAAILEQKIKASRLVRDGKLLFEMGKLDEAEAKLKLALREDLNNEAALYYLNLVAEARPERTGGLRKVPPSPRRELLPVPNPDTQTNLVHSNQRRLTILTKLNRIRFERISFDNLSLREVVRSLSDEAQKRDPDKFCVNIIIASAGSAQVPPGASLDSPTGLPKAGMPAGPLDVSATPITINPPLTNVRLVDVLDAIVRVAGQPIKYSIQDYAVEFSAKTDEGSPPLYTRTFRVDPNTFLAGLGSAKGLASTNGPGGIASALRDFFEQAGANLAPPKSLFYNDRQGVLMVRTTLQDLDIIEQSMAVLYTAPPQVNIKVKFVEVSQDDTKAFGFDWYLGNMLVNTGSTGGQVGTAPANAGSPAATNSLTAFPGNPRGPASSTTAPGSNHKVAPFVLPNPSTSPSSLTGILTDPQSRMVLKALQQRSGTEFLAQPDITTLSGRQAQMQMVTMTTVVKGINERALTPPGITTTNDDASSLYVTESISCGPIMDVIANVMADGYTIELMMIPSVTEFLGYQEDQTNRVAVYVDGKKKWVSPPRPIVRQRKLSASVRVWDGQTVVLGGLPSETVTTLKDKVPVLGDLPLLGRMFRSESKATTKKNLLIFVTPTLIDAAGNRIHTEDELPFTRDAVPPQPAR